MVPGSVWITLASSAGVCAIVLAVVNGLLNRKNLGANTTKLITDAAAGTIKDMREDYSRVREERDLYKKRAEEKEAELDRKEARWLTFIELWKRTLQVHAAWDMLKMADCTEQLPQAPPLTPPLSWEDMSAPQVSSSQ